MKTRLDPLGMISAGLPFWRFSRTPTTNRWRAVASWLGALNTGSDFHFSASRMVSMVGAMISGTF
jgi:hypothetical protein